jgi:hypothetical protein
MKRYFAGAIALSLYTPLAALAAAQRTFVSVEGSDVAPCSISAPCRSFTQALAQTNAGGEVIVLDSGGYDAFTVDKAVSIVAPSGIYAGITVTSGNGVTIAAGSSDSVTLRGLVLNSLGGASGVQFASGSILVVDGCTISGDFAKGVGVDGPLDTRVIVKDTQISNAAIGIDVAGPGGELVRLSVIDSALLHVGTGVRVAAKAEATIENSRLVGLASNAGTGVDLTASSGHAPLRVHVANTLIREFGVGASAAQSALGTSLSIAASELAHNGTAVRASAATVALDGNRLAYNDQAIAIVSGGTVASSGTNYTAYNVSNGDPVAAPVGTL